ncbi:hypothetical protein GOARA_091_00320 [Gordonia araii NBRC 100433]|uniref:Uncharacterized protein n=1 Tax=Gordonia araii NBRC 100433 TaxID=1073574 RepID=G7H7T9_9ACTN|nr:hypothetical protein [Gordonia araii]NNG95645.1 hypothetical protein [Gordonia araii NBRC 100433]GAB11914.1 hypothetical protein GOARA_091_00320 [Gordonia araii NBRC 100433]
MTTASLRNGALSVQTTEQGLPLAIKVDDSQLQRDPSLLAKDLLRLCQQAAVRAGLERRRALEEAGVPSEIVAQLGLPTADQAARQEIRDEWEDEHETTTWMRSV